MSIFSHLLYSFPFLDTYDASEAPDLTDRVFIVTGGTDGLGFETALALARKNAHVFITSRSLERGERALEKMKERVPEARIELILVELSSFSSIRKAVDGFIARKVPLHCLINNAGAAAPMGQLGQHTKEGIEVTYATNFYGPLYLTLKLLPLLLQSAESRPTRIIWHSSGAEALGKVDWDDLKGTRHSKSELTAYATSKLMDLMAAVEMARRVGPQNIRVFAVHPGVTNAGIYRKTDSGLLASHLLSFMNYLIGQPPVRGARSIIYAATDPHLDAPEHNGAYIGGFLGGNLWQTKKRTPLNPQARDKAACARLYEKSVALIAVEAPDADVLHV